MPSGFLHGWDPDAEGWVKVVCNPAGELDIDAAAIFENPPTEDEEDKGPSSAWAFAHNADTDKHHARYTDVESRAAIGDVIDDRGWLAKMLNYGYFAAENVGYFRLKRNSSDKFKLTLTKVAGDPDFLMYCAEVGVGNVDFNIMAHNGVEYVRCIRTDTFQVEMALYLEDTPSDEEVNKAPTSNWAYDHGHDAAIHDIKYTDAEAQAACKLDGNLYYSCSGLFFGATNPATDEVTWGVNGVLQVVTNSIALTAPLFLPHGATVTNAIVHGNEAAESNNWTLYRLTLSDQTLIAMATAAINTGNASITVATIDNSLYSYHLLLWSMETDNEVKGAIITYTL